MTVTTEEMYKKIKPPKKKKIILTTAIVIILLVSIGAIVYQVNFTKEEIVYSTVKASYGNVTSVISTSGTLSATNEVEVGSQLSGKIVKVFADVNDKVKLGDTLAVIDPETILQNIDKAKAQINSAKAQLTSSEVTYANKKWNYDRLMNLYESTGKKSPSLYELENAKLESDKAFADINIRKAAVVEAETILQSAQIDFRNSFIKSPIDGVVLQRTIEAGQTVASSFSTPKLFLVAENLEKMKLVVYVSEADVGKVTVGQAVKFTVDAYPDDTFQSIIFRIDAGSTKSSDNIISYKTTIYIDNPKLLLRSGMNATADIETASATNALLVPTPALYFNLSDAGEKSEKAKSGPGLFIDMQRPKIEIADTVAKNSKKGQLWVLENGTPKKVDVELGVSDGKFTQIIGNELTDTTEVITHSAVKK